MKTYDEILERLFIHLRPLAPPTIEDDFDLSVPLNALADGKTPGQLATLVHRIVEDG